LKIRKKSSENKIRFRVILNVLYFELSRSF
jgi:hypothetical protein